MTHSANIQAVLWDFDGTLVQTERLHADLERQVLAELGVDLDPKADLDGVGRPTRALFAAALAAAGRPELLEAALARRLELARAQVLPRAHPTRGVERVLLDVPMRTHRFAVVTSTERALVEPIVERLGWTWRFEVMVTLDDVQAPKPDPEPYRLAVQRLGLEPRQCLVVEDSPPGVEAGRAAGCRVAALPGTFPAAALHRAHYVLSNVGAVAGLLGVLK